MAVDTLNALVSSAIWRAQQLDELGVDTSILAWREVSKLEEELAKSLPVKDAEGRIARRGAVRAALKAMDRVRGDDLVERYVKEKGTPRTLIAELRQMLKVDAEELSAQFPFAAKHHKATDVQSLANAIQQTGPFGLAA